MIKKPIDYVGWAGHGNLGDEALFIAIRNLFSEFNLKQYNNYNFLVDSKPLVIPKIDKHSSSVCVFGGGTLLPDDITWVKPSRYNYLFGAGMKHPSFRSKYVNFSKTVVDRLKKFDFRFIGVRDNVSQALLSNFDIPSEVIGDPALSLKPSSKIKRDEFKVAVNVGCDGLLWGEDQEHVVLELTRVCKILKEKGYTPILIPFSATDVSDIRRISKSAKTEVFSEWFRIDSVIDLIASCKVLIGQRLHSAVLSAATFTPFVSLEYRPKCSQFSESVKMLDYSIRTDSVTAEHVLRLFQNLMNDWCRAKKNLASTVEAYREKQIIFAKSILHDIKSLSDNEWLSTTPSGRIKDELFWKIDLFLRKNFGNIWELYNKLLFLRMMRFLI
jgi:hypothetical protein